MKKLFPIKFVFVLTVICSVIQDSRAHTFYEGISELSYNSRTHTIELVHRFTTHDVMLMLREVHGADVNPEQASFEAILKDYFERHFQLERAEQKLQLKWIGFESGINETTVYQELVGITSVSGLTVTNDLLSHFYSKQLNRLNYKDKITKGTLVFNKQNKTQTIIK